MKLQGALKAFCEEENGASDMVAVYLYLVIIIAIATLFNGRLSEIVGQILDNLGAFARGGILVKP